MLTPNEIADRLEALTAEIFPGEKIYRELLPNGFERPCNLIVLDDCEVDVGLGVSAVGLIPSFTVSTFVPVDEYHHSHLAAMHMRQTALAGLFIPGYIRVGDRAPHVEKLVLDGGYDYDTVTVSFRYAVDREEFLNTAQRPLIGTLKMNEEVKEHGRS